jgi:hypothetical protein
VCAAPGRAEAAAALVPAGAPGPRDVAPVVRGGGGGGGGRAAAPCAALAHAVVLTWLQVKRFVVWSLIQGVQYIHVNSISQLAIVAYRSVQGSPALGSGRGAVQCLSMFVCDKIHPGPDKAHK